MTTATNTAEQQRVPASLLKHAQRRLQFASIRARLSLALHRSIQAAVVASVTFAVWRLAGGVNGSGYATFGTTMTLAGIAALLSAVTVLGPAVFHPPTLREVAERLDLAAGDHNRIAIAVELIESDATSPFVQPAIADGLAHLVHLSGQAPAVQPIVTQWKRTGGWAALLAVVVFLAPFVGGRTATRASQPTDRLTASPHTSSETAGAPAPATRPDALYATSTPSQTQVVVHPSTRPAASQDRHVAQLGNEQAIARADGEFGSTSRTTNGISGEAGQATPSAASSGAERKQVSAASTTRREAGARPSTNDPQHGSEASSVGQGRGSGRAVSVAKNAWSSRLQSSDNARADEDPNEPVQDEPASSTQRGGVQPLLKDRQAAPSRELGISGDEGMPGTGRGGPTPPKKSRGTASLVLGSPIPDFVRGPMGPGTTKTTRERVTPSPMPGESARSVSPAQRMVPESPSTFGHVPGDWAAVARDYLTALHSSDTQQSRNDESPAVSTAPMP
jgi:hypothetical protein